MPNVPTSRPCSSSDFRPSLVLSGVVLTNELQYKGRQLLLSYHCNCILYRRPGRKLSWLDQAVLGHVAEVRARATWPIMAALDASAENTAVSKLRSFETDITVQHLPPMC